MASNDRQSRLYERLRTLSAAQFDALVLRLNVDDSYLPPPLVEPATRAMSLLKLMIALSGDEGLSALEIGLQTMFTARSSHSREAAVAGQGTNVQPSAGGDVARSSSAAASAYEALADAFRAQYLGRPEAPVPFGGRHEELARLNEWLDDLRAPSYRIVAAPAGRGKSALLVRWAESLKGRSDLAVVFFPISIRFNTNLAGVVFASLALQLARLHGESLHMQFDTPALIWRATVTRYLTRPLPDGRRLVLILDGLDEAADWHAGPDLFPHGLPGPSRVLASARLLEPHSEARSWLVRLDLNRPGLAAAHDLPPLTRSGITDVLLGMQSPLDGLGDRAEIVATLHHLSQGDPLLIGLYVDALRGHGESAAWLRPEDLHTIKPGIEGYFERWWLDQCGLWEARGQRPMLESTVRAVLNLLACALGPLPRGELITLAPPESGLHAWALDEALRALERFIIRDARTEGLMFSHPRLAGYFYEERLPLPERRVWEGRFTDRGMAVLDELRRGTMKPAEAPGYYLTYLGAHLNRVGAPLRDLFALLSEEWLRAHDAAGRSFAGFVGDVERAWDAAASANREAVRAHSRAPYLAVEVRCALCVASVTSLIARVPSFLISALVRHGLWTSAQGMAHARRLAQPEERSTALLDLCGGLPPEERDEAIQLAWEAAAEIESASSRLRATVALIPHLSEDAGRTVLDGALAGVAHLVSLMPHPPPRAKRRKDDDANYTPAEAGVSWEPAVLDLQSLAPLLPPAMSAAALTIAVSLPHENDRAAALTALAPHLPATLLRRALSAARDLTGELFLAAALKGLAPHLPAFLLEEARIAARAIPQAEVRAPVMIELARRSPQARGDALQAVRGLANIVERVRALVGLFPSLPQPEQQGVLRELERAITRWTHVLEGVALRAAFASIMAPSQREPLVEEALALAERCDAEDERVEALAYLVPLLPARLHDWAHVIALRLKDGALRARALSALAEAVPEAASDALEALGNVGSAEEQGSILFDLIPRLPLAALPDVFARARSIDDVRWLCHALRRLTAIPSSTADHVIAAVIELKDDGAGVEALVIVADRVQEPHRSRALREALDRSRRLGHDIWSVFALNDLVPHASEAKVREALQLLWTAQDKEWLDAALRVLVSKLPRGLVEEMIRETKKHVPHAQRRKTITAAIRSGRRNIQAPEAARPSEPSTSGGIERLEQWQRLLRQQAQRGRQELTGKLSSLTPVLMQLGVPGDADEVISAVLDVLRWWP